MQNSETLLVADIGGTHARFGLLEPHGFVPFSEQKYLCASFSSFESVLHEYMQDLGPAKPAAGAIAIAAPVWNDRVSMTNLSWTFSVSELKAKFGFDRLEVINDASAGVLATTRTEGSSLIEIKSGQKTEHGTRVNLIPGTGFGIGAAYCFNGFWQPVQGEGGHIGLAAHEPEEFEMLKALTGIAGRATPETALSGPGMLTIYRALAQVRDVQAADLSPAQMTRMGVDRSDLLCSDAVDMYCGLLGSLAGDYALVFGAHGGVYLSGNVLQKLGAERLREPFTRRFLDKGKMDDEVRHISVSLVQREFPGLLGAAVWLHQLGLAGSSAKEASAF